MNRVIRRVAILLFVSLLMPVFIVGFAWRVATNWFEFGKNAAITAEDEWIGLK